MCCIVRFFFSFVVVVVAVFFFFTAFCSTAHRVRRVNLFAYHVFSQQAAQNFFLPRFLSSPAEDWNVLLCKFFFFKITKAAPAGPHVKLLDEVTVRRRSNAAAADMKGRGILFWILPRWCHTSAVFVQFRITITAPLVWGIAAVC